jgi:hypothetical protein
VRFATSEPNRCRVDVSTCSASLRASDADTGTYVNGNGTAPGAFSDNSYTGNNQLTFQSTPDKDYRQVDLASCQLPEWDGTTNHVHNALRVTLHKRVSLGPIGSLLHVMRVTNPDVDLTASATACKE